MQARAPVTIILLVLAGGVGLDAQTSRRPTSASRPAAKPAPAPDPIREPPLMQCPSILGNGLTSKRLYCDILGASPDGSGGLRVNVPPHSGSLTLSFTLHNRQTYSASEVKAGKAFARYTATLRIASDTGQVLGQAVVRSEFRTEKDLVERIAGGAGPGGAKAVAPTGAERIVFPVPDGVSDVVISGEKLTIETLAGTQVVTAPGRPYAVVSEVEVEYRPPAPAPAKRRR